MTGRTAHIDARRGADAALPGRVTVLGAARSGLAAAELLRMRGSEVFVSDTGKLAGTAQATLSGQGVSWEDGGHTARCLDADLIVTSPGIPRRAHVLADADERGIPVWSELELGWRCFGGRTVAVTGTNGKTTTTLLIHHILRSAGLRAHACGNVGTPVSHVVARGAGPGDVLVVEASSFQLERVDRFRPDVAVLLPITPDHLDRYDGDMDAYFEAKMAILAQQGEDDAVVYPMQDVRIAAFIGRRGTAARPLGIDMESGAAGDAAPGSAPDAAPGSAPGAATIPAAFFREGELFLANEHNQQLLMNQQEMALKGRHNVYNSLAAAVAARVLEVRSDFIRESLSTFSGVPHRLETVRVRDGVTWVNDSKATNVNAVWYALDSFREPIVLIVGGRDKAGDFAALQDQVKSRVRGIVTLGEAASAIESALGSCVADCVRASDMPDAVRLAGLLARQGDVVLLSPACASFDMFTNFEERGDAFRRIVAGL